MKNYHSIEILYNGLKEGTALFHNIKKGEGIKSFNTYGGSETKNLIAYCNNEDFISSYIREYGRAKMNFVYIDPPFFSKSKYNATVKAGEILIHPKAYDDNWHEGPDKYIAMLVSRLCAIKEMLTEDGVVAVHLDWHMVHYAKIILDEIFGIDNFINEIIWQYKSGGARKKGFAAKHDTVLIYGNSKNYKFNRLFEKSYNRGFKPYGFKGVKEYEDEQGWYTMVGAKDVWSIDMVGRTSRERTGYATQKPEALIEKLILAFTDREDICCDIFSGSGTLAKVARKQGRRYAVCDNSGLSLGMILKRLDNLEDAAIWLDGNLLQSCEPDFKSGSLQNLNKEEAEMIGSLNRKDLILHEQVLNNKNKLFIDVVGRVWVK